MPAHAFDETPCALGEGPFWAEGRLYWFDIIARRLHARGPGETVARTWDFDEHFSAGAPLAGGGIMLASETGLWRFDPGTGARERIVGLEADNPVTRSNDGRADPLGGFWIGTMGKAGEPGAGAIHRYHRGELRRLLGDVSVSNAICFSPDGARGYFADSPTRTIMTWALDAEGWPIEPPAPFFTLDDVPGVPDGAVVDAQGALWVAIWGGGRVVRISAAGALLEEISLPAPQPTCPAFGADPTTLYVTSARAGLGAEALAAHPLSGAVFAAPIAIAGPPHPQVAARA